MFTPRGEHKNNVVLASRILNIPESSVIEIAHGMHKLSHDISTRRKEIHQRGINILHDYYHPSVTLFSGNPVNTDEIPPSPQSLALPLHPYQQKAVSGMILSECLSTNHPFFSESTQSLVETSDVVSCITGRRPSLNIRAPYVYSSAYGAEPPLNHEHTHSEVFHATGGVLNMDVGTGKSSITLATVRLTLDDCTRWMHASPIGTVRAGTLILAPPQLMRQWKAEIKKFCPGVNISYQYGASPTSNIDNVSIILSSYNTFQQRFRTISSAVQFYRVVFDEGHGLKLHRQISSACIRINSLRRWVITATPLTGSMDLIKVYYYLLHIVCPVENFTLSLEYGGCLNKVWWRYMNRETSFGFPAKLRDIYNHDINTDVHNCEVFSLDNAYTTFKYGSRKHPNSLIQSVACAATLGALSSIIIEYPVVGCATSRLNVTHVPIAVQLPSEYLQFLRTIRNEIYWDTFTICQLFRYALSVVQTREQLLNLINSRTMEKRKDALSELIKTSFNDFVNNGGSVPDRVRSTINYIVSDGMDCCICMESLDDIVITKPCHHIFCKTCALQWRSMRVTCPICRTKTTSLINVIMPSERNISVDAVPPPPQTEVYFTPRIISGLDYIGKIPEDANILVFVEFPIVGQYVANILSNECSVGIITGSTTMHAKHRILERFQKGSLRVLILTYALSSTGLNITRANYVVMLEPPDTKALKKQAIGRAVREGQERSVTVATFTCAKTFEEKFPRDIRLDKLPNRIIYE